MNNFPTPKYKIGDIIKYSMFEQDESNFSYGKVSKIFVTRIEAEKDLLLYNVEGDNQDLEEARIQCTMEPANTNTFKKGFYSLLEMFLHADWSNSNASHGIDEGETEAVDFINVICKEVTGKDADKAYKEYKNIPDGK